MDCRAPRLRRAARNDGLDFAEREANGMIDTFALAVSHGLILLAAIRLLSRPDLDDDAAPATRPKPVWRANEEPGDA
ncbi:hypothetical protein [Allosphingosinicella indica]|uniref:Uncharacterized protein n=1 Tax=Allosphingosinicella indica TaxID=941907 RepID=A0A1X7G625_9SPHN|nr:hypothetical protein [Allosphingosinicella indica]SMF64695.1 hypothetical protein SAMN06295910_1226 [Allosphingosinicella indica]